MFKRFALVVCAFTLSLSAFAQVKLPQEPTKFDLNDDDAMIQIGVGAMNSDKTVDVLLRVEGNAIVNNGSSYYVIARVKSDVATNGKALDYVDIQFNGLGFGISEKDLFSKGFIDITFLNFNYSKNVAINQNNMARITFIGLRGGYENKVTDDLAFLIKGSVDLLGFGLSDRINETQNGRTDGIASGASIEAGFKFLERYKITFSHTRNVVQSDPVQYYNGTSCSTYYYDDCYDPYYGYGAYCGGWAQTTCGPNYSTRYTQQRTSSSTALNITADISKNFQAFGQVAYNVYKVRAELGQTVESRNDAIQFKFGAVYKF